jgi:glutamate formiminotransferase
MSPSKLLAIPNVSEGRDRSTIEAIAAAFTETPADTVSLLDVHSDIDHHRSVFTLAGQPTELAQALLRGAHTAIARIDVMSRAGGGHEEIGQHPHVGALDVMPIVYLDRAARGAACAEALVVGDRIGDELGVPVFLYGELSGTTPEEIRTRAQLRRGGVLGLAQRMVAGHMPLTPDFGPSRPHPTAGATLLAVREPLVAFNLQLAPPATVHDARRIAALIREGGEHGLPGLRAIGVSLQDGQLAQVSMNVERPLEVPLAAVVDAVRAHADLHSAELVGLAPAAALEGFPEDLAMPGFDPVRHVIENALGC